jgi:monovalent cation:H+ antiporter-2, CPA2 family
MAINHHVIICGFGRCGQNLARMLESEGIAYIALDLDPDRVSQAAAAGFAVEFGDAARLQALMAAGLSRARALVITPLELTSAKKILAHAQAHAPHVPVIVRTKDDQALDALRHAGATEVVPEAIEGSLMLASHALALVGVPMRRVLRIVQDQRDARYSLLRGFFHGADDSASDDVDQIRLLTITLTDHCHAVGCALSELGLDAMSIRTISWRHADGTAVVAEPHTVLQSGDTLVLSGLVHDLARAEHHLLIGS